MPAHKFPKAGRRFADWHLHLASLHLPYWERVHVAGSSCYVLVCAVPCWAELWNIESSVMERLTGRLAAEAAALHTADISFAFC